MIAKNRTQIICAKTGNLSHRETHLQWFFHYIPRLVCQQNCLFDFRLLDALLGVCPKRDLADVVADIWQHAHRPLCRSMRVLFLLWDTSRQVWHLVVQTLLLGKAPKTPLAENLSHSETHFDEKSWRGEKSKGAGKLLAPWWWIYTAVFRDKYKFTGTTFCRSYFFWNKLMWN